MKALTIIAIFATFCTSHAQTVWGNGQNYFVYPTGGMTTVIGDRGATTIQPMAGSVNVMSTSPRIDQGALNAAALATLVAPQTALPARTQANPPIDAVAQYKAQQDAAWAQANQTLAIAMASMPPSRVVSNSTGNSKAKPDPEKPLPKPKNWNEWIAWCKSNNLPNRSLPISDYNTLVRAFHIIENLNIEQQSAISKPVANNVSATR